MVCKQFLWKLLFGFYDSAEEENAVCVFEGKYLQCYTIRAICDHFNALEIFYDTKMLTVPSNQIN